MKSRWQLNCVRRVFDARPHPSPLPQEREERSTTASKSRRGQIAVSFNPSSRGAAKARVTLKAYENVHCYSLSPGERVRVRAGFVTNQADLPCQNALSLIP